MLSNKVFKSIYIHYLLLSLSGWLVLGTTIANRYNTPVCYEILEESKLFLEGATNVNSFVCDCTGIDALPPDYLEMNIEKNPRQVLFSKADLHIKTKLLDCGHQIMNKDLYECLKAKHHPHISISLKKVQLTSGVDHIAENEWASIQSEAMLTIAGKSKNVFLDVEACKEGQQTYRFMSQYNICMTDFGITPPTTMLGLVKVEDQITIHFDLLVRID